MNLKEFIFDKHIFNELAEIRKQLGAPFILFKGSSQIRQIDVQPLPTNIDGTFDEIKADLSQLESGYPILDKDGKCRFLYIPDHNYGHFHDLSSDNLKKVHITYCSTLSDMKSKKRFERYRATLNTSDLFEIQMPNGKITSTKLNVCQHCIRLMKSVHSNFDKFGTYNSFDLKNFSQAFSKKMPSEFVNASLELKNNQYTKDWTQVSIDYRASKKWTCEECGEDCKKNPKNLHTHHINGIKSDNNIRNLRVLCKACHKAQPKHGHY